MVDVGHGLGVYWGTYGLFELIYYLFDKCVLGREILRLFLWTHEMPEYTHPYASTLCLIA